MPTSLPLLGRFLELLTPRERWRLAGIVALVLTTAAVEILAIAALFPFLGVAAQPERIAETPAIAQLHALAGHPEPRAFLLQLGGVVFGLIVAANLLRLATLWANYRYAWGVQHALACRLLAGYATLPFRDWLRRSPADAHTRIVSEVTNTTITFIIPLLDLLMHSVAAVAITGLILVIDPVLALAVGGILSLAYAGLYVSIRRWLRRIGAERLHHNRTRYRLAREFLTGLKDVRLLRAERAQLAGHEQAGRQYSRSEALRLTLALAPKYALELVAFGSILAVLLVLLARADDFASIVPTVGLFAFAGYRLMPRVQGVFQALTNMRVNRETLEQLVAEVRALQQSPEPVLEDLPPIDAPATSIALQGVTFRHADAEHDALHDATLTVPVHATVGIVGPSGAGKSTAVDVLLGLLTPDAGALELDGQPLTLRQRVAWRGLVGHVPQHIFLADDTLRANIALGVPADRVDEERIARVLALAQLTQVVASELPEGLDTRIGDNGFRLSGGQRQRVGIARALYHDPAVLVFDEATSSLDNITEGAIMDAIHTLSGTRTIILVAHRLSTVRACSRIIVMDRGRVEAEGTWDEVQQSSTVLQRLMAAGGEGG